MQTLTTTTPETNACPRLDSDPFAEEVLRNPYPFHEQLREAGPLVWLERYGIWATGHFEHVDATLRDWQTFCSGAGVGLANFHTERPWRRPSIILEADPPLHTRTRGVLSRILSPVAIKKLRETFAQQAEILVERLVAGRRFDAVTDLARVFPTRVFPEALGIRYDGSDNLLRYGDMNFNAFGPRNALFERSMANADEVSAWIMQHCERDALSSDGFGAQIYAAADNGELSYEEAGLLVRSFLAAGLDTTINGLGNALYCFAHHPEQWQALRAAPTLARGAFDEVLRFESPVQTFFRTAAEDTVLAGQPVARGQKVMLSLGAANRDARHWEAPERFDITRRATGHVGFGAGIHGCVGQMVARLEADVVFKALVDRVAHFELDGEPEPYLNNTLHGWASLPVRIEPA